MQAITQDQRDTLEIMLDNAVHAMAANVKTYPNALFFAMVADMWQFFYSLP